MKNNDLSPFHDGEKAIQELMGVRNRMEKFGKMVIRKYMPIQFQDFFQNLPFILIGHADKQGNIWASILFMKSGLINIIDEQHLVISTAPIEGDPLAKTLSDNKVHKLNTQLGFLGIDLVTRRRNRMTGHVNKYSGSEISVKIDQTFGNCPKYIQSRSFEHVSTGSDIDKNIGVFESFKNPIKKIIEKSDTFFIASHINENQSQNNTGSDVSHRGGLPGFVKINDDNTLTIPDYSGNNHFNTLGNILLNPKVGLLFIDFKTSNILMLTGQVEIVWNSDEIKQFDGALRLIKFKLNRAIYIVGALPMNWSKPDISANFE